MESSVFSYRICLLMKRCEFGWINIQESNHGSKRQIFKIRENDVTTKVRNSQSGNNASKERQENITVLTLMCIIKILAISVMKTHWQHSEFYMRES